jgi:ribosomal protein S18 acetylase RimI-like enzyme
MAHRTQSDAAPARAAIRCVELAGRHAAAALPVWREAAQWLAARDLPLWNPAIFDQDFVEDAQARGIIIAAMLEETVAGVALLQWRDDLWWPDRPPTGAAYIHKLAVARAAAGRGVADALIAECERRARLRSLECIRLDTAADRPVLRSLYERLGYRALDVRRVDSLVGVRYEKSL